MAVYTEVTDEALAAFLADYDIGSMVAFRGIAEGVENSNYSLRTTAGDFILTLYEKRVDPADLPWFLGLMEHLARRGIVCPLPVHGRDGAALRHLCRPACRDHHLPARASGRAGCGRSIARRWARRWPRCTWPARDYAPTPAQCARAGTAGGRCWSARRARADEVQPGLAAELDAALAAILAAWPRGAAGRAHPCRPVSRQRVLPGRAGCPA